GEHLRHDILKCQLAPLDRSEYDVDFTDEQWARLQEAFPDGVCDWSRPGVGQQPSVSWQTFAEGPGGRPLGPPPTSTPNGPAGTAPLGHRLGGTDRISTAIAVAQHGWPEGGAAPTVVLARGDGEQAFADALAGTPLAVALDAPLLLTSSHRLLGNVADELRRLLREGAEVVLLGGEAALAPAIESALREIGFEPRRIAGATRVETALAIASELGEPPALLIASGEDFPDALSAGAAAAQAGGAVLLTPAGRRHPANDAYLGERPEVLAYAVGGPAAAGYPDATPVVGATREATAVEVARIFFEDPTSVGFAVSSTYPDALAGGTHVARRGGPVLLTPADGLYPEVTAYLCGVAGTVQDVITYGGTRAVPDAVAADALTAARGEGC
ncbi:MAG: cell wall-binding repeat-containing protein, partial [Actinobacteria bacterium]|nr:cell wall-binding repeat-containing protein [Actinomycetota bacterium]